MRADPEVKLSGFGAGGRPRLSVRFHSLDPLLTLYKQVRDKGVFSIAISEDQPTALQIQVLFRTRRRGEEFPATILTWSRGLAVLQPNLSLPDFKELTGTLVVNLSEESGQSEGASTFLDSKPRSAQDTLQDLQQAGARIQAAALKKLRRTQDDLASSPPPTEIPRRLETPIPSERGSDAHIAATRDARTAGTSPARTAAEAPVDAPNPSEPPAAPARDRVEAPLADNQWLTTTGSFQRVPTGMARTPTGAFSRVPSADVPIEAYRFLDHLRLRKPELAEGSGSGEQALALVGALDDAPTHGLLGVSADDERRWFLFYQGQTLLTGYLRPISAVTALPTLLCRQGLITVDAADAAFRYADDYAVPEEKALEEIGAAPPDLLRKALRAKVKLLLSLLRGERHVRWTFWALEVPLALPGLVEFETERVRFASVFEQYERRPLSELLAPYADRLGHYPLLRGDADELADLFALDASTKHFLTKCLSGEHTLRQLPQVSSLGRQRSYAVTFALADLGYVTLLERDTAELGDRRFVKRLEAQHEKVHQVDDFDFIAVHWSASEREVMQAATKLEKEFSGPKVARLSAPQQLQARTIVDESRRIRDALATLEARRFYRSEILDVFAVDQAVELLLSNFDMAVYRQDLAEINRILSRLKELDPGAALKARARLPKSE